MAHQVFVALNLLVYFFIGTSAIMWSLYFFKLLRVHTVGDKVPDGPRIQFVARSSPFWNAADFLVMFGCFVLAGSGLGMFFVSRGWLRGASQGAVAADLAPDVARAMDVSELYAKTYIGLLASFISIGVALGFVLLPRSDKRQAFKELGFNFNKTTFAQGLWASLWLIPPVLLVSLIVSALIPYKHPVLDTLAAIVAERSLMGFLLLFVSTAVVTPLVEEFMFRVLLQGGLQGMFDRPDRDVITPSPQAATQWQARSWWPIVLTSLLFAGMHLGQGAAPIPLFFLSLGLGYLYRQTGSLVPPLVVHVVLNATTTIIEFTRLLAA